MADFTKLLDPRDPLAAAIRAQRAGRLGDHLLLAGLDEPTLRLLAMMRARRGKDLPGTIFAEGERPRWAPAATPPMDVPQQGLVAHLPTMYQKALLQLAANFHP